MFKIVIFFLMTLFLLIEPAYAFLEYSSPFIKYGQVKDSRSLELDLKFGIDNKYKNITELEKNRIFADVYLYEHNYKKVLEKENEILNYLETHKNINNYEEEALFERARLICIYAELGNPKKSEILCQKYLQTLKEHYGSKSKETLCLMRILAQNYHNLGREQESLQLYQELVELNKEVYGANSKEAWLSFNDLAAEQLITEGAQNTNDSFLQLLEFVKILPDNDENKYDKLRINNNIANWYIENGQYDLSLHIMKMLFEQCGGKYEKVSLAKLPKGELPERQVDILRSISKCYSYMRNDTEAMNYNLLAFDLANLLYGNEHQITLNIMADLADIYLSLGKYEDAFNMSSRVLKLSQEVCGETGITTLESMYCMARAYSMFGNYKKAKELDRKIFETIMKLRGYNPNDRIKFVDGLVSDYVNLKEYKPALNLQKMILDESSTYLGEEHPNTLYEKVVLADIYNGLNLEEYRSTAIELSSNALNIQQQILSEDDANILYTIGVLARAYHLNGQDEKAVKYYKELISGYEKVRSNYTSLSSENKARWFSTKIDNYKNAANVFCKAGLMNEAFQTAELCKARELAERYSDQLVEADTVFEAGEKSQFLEYQKQIDSYKNLIKESLKSGDIDKKLALEREQNAIAEKYRVYKKSLQNKYPQYQTIANLQNVNIEQDKNVLAQGTCYINFTTIKSDNEVLAFVVKPNNQIEGVTLPVDKSMLDQCQVYHELLAYQSIESMRADNKYLWKLSDGSYKITSKRQPPAEDSTIVNSTKEFSTLRQQLSTTIGETLLNPLHSQISANSTWIISPDGELNNVPFETLQYNGQNAIQATNISYVPSFTMIKIMKERAAKNATVQNRKELFAMGDAIYGNSDLSTSRGSLIDFSEEVKRSSDSLEDIDLTKLKWNNLPGTGKELDQVSMIFSGNNKEIVRRENASEQNLKEFNKSGSLSQYKYFLFATHGLFVPEKPELSSIVLSQGMSDKYNDGYVTIGEWMGYNLNSDLVYLSACESGLGEYQAGEGIVGIPYALTIAGNKDTVMSLWKVNDEATAEFSSTFFKKLSEGKSEILALNETKREFMSNPNAKFNSPSVWAAFLLYGI